MGQVANEFDARHVAIVDFGRQKICVDDQFVAVRIPQARMVLDHVEPERDDEVRIVDHQIHAVSGAKTDGKQTVLGVHVDAPLGHERTDHADAGLLAQQPQLLAGTTADATVAGNDHGALGVAQQVERAIDDLVVRNRAAESGDGKRLPIGFELREILW